MKILIFGLPLIVAGSIFAIYLFQGYNNHPTTIEIMDVANICRPVPENDAICGESVIHENGTLSKYTYTHLANGTYIITDCLSDEYPRNQNSTHFKCGEHDWRTYKELIETQSNKISEMQK